MTLISLPSLSAVWQCLTSFHGFELHCIDANISSTGKITVQNVGG